MTPRFPNLRRGITRIEIVVTAILVLLCAGLLGVWPGVVFFLLLFGWIVYPFQVAGDITIEPVAVLTSLLALALFTWGVYSFGKWLARETSTKERPRTWTVSQSVQLVVLILFAFVAGTSMIGIVHQVTWMATTEEGFFSNSRNPARRSASKNNLKQIGLAFHNYHDSHQHFASSTFTTTGEANHSWQTYLLPFIDQAPLYKQIDTNLPWTHPENRQFFDIIILAYLNPGIDHKANPDLPALSHYAGNIRLLVPNQNPKISNITDGTTNTILSGEVGTHFKAWGDPTNLRDPALGINKHPNGFGGPSEGGSQFVFADGSVRFLAETIDPKVLKALATPAGGEEIDDDAY